MEKQLNLYVLGNVAIELDDQPVQSLPSRAAEALLVYLVCHDRPVSREVLADMLWRDRTQKQALGNLRTILSGLRRELGDYLIVTRHSLGFNHAANYRLDAAEFEAQLGDVPTVVHPAAALPATLVHQLQTALDLYRGDFLAGFYLNDGPDFEEWALLVRERLRHRACEALRLLVHHHLRAGNHQAGIRWARRLLELDPLREEGHRQLMRLLALCGRRNAALKQYQTCRAVLENELGVAPAPETTMVYERIRAARFAGQHNLPPQFTPFFGRQAELTWIADRLAQPSCRLLTLVGMGGIGKTRVAVEAATRQVGRFLNGVYFIALESVSSPDFIIPALAETLGFTLFGEEPPQQELLNFLSDKELLLIFDNFEHLMAGSGLILDILRHAPAVKILVTSRERLGFQAEWVLEIRGLGYPTSDVKADVQDFSAVQLFVERRSRVKAGFSLFEETDVAVARICRLVEGAPLGIELAAASVGMYSCREIAAQIERNLDFLKTSLRDVPQRQRSLQAVFEHSWQLLSAAERDILKQLSVFQGPYTGKAAHTVAGATPAVLATLVDKSLLRQNQANNYDIHPLLKQYVAEKLAATSALEAGAKTRHCQYFTNYLQQREPALKSNEQIKALADIETVIENVRTAWQWAVANQGFEAIGLALEGLYLFYWARSLFQEGKDTFEQAARVVFLSRKNDLLLARIQARQAEFLTWLSDYDEAQALLLDAIEIFRSHHAQSELALALELRGRIEYSLGRYPCAREYFEQVLALYRQIDDQFGQAQALNSLANTICDESADYDQAYPLYEESLAIASQIGDLFGVAKVLVNLGAVAQELQDYPEARRLYTGSLNIYREIEYKHGQSAVLNYLGQVACLLGDYPSAQTLLQECLDINRQIGNRRAMCDTLNQLGNVAYHTGDFVQSTQHYHEALRLAADIKATDFVLNILVGLAQIFDQNGQRERALEMLAFVTHHSDGGQTVKDRADELLGSLKRELSPDVAATHYRQGKNGTLENMTRAILRQGLVYSQ